MRNSWSGVLRLATVASATRSPTPGLISTTCSLIPSKISSSMSQRLVSYTRGSGGGGGGAAVSFASANFSRARLVRRRPGFVPSLMATSSWHSAASPGVAPAIVATRAMTNPSCRQHLVVSRLVPRNAIGYTARGRGSGTRCSLSAAAVAGERGDAAAASQADAIDGQPPFKANLLEMGEEEVETFVKGLGEPKYRAKQVLKWIYEERARSFEDMSNLPKALRAKLADVATVGALEVAAKQTSKDGTRKVAYRLSDGQLIESVLMPYSDGRRTACISSQAGCAMGCVFCATGQMGFKRQLSSSEIFEQAYRFSQELAARGDRLSNVVLMGMGEPLANYNNVMEAVRRINAELGIGARHITISTVGLVPRILRLSQEDIQVKLAVSLHAANDRERSALLPVNRRFPLSELMDACREYVHVSGRRITFEWALIRGENDSAETASELGRLLRPLKGMCHVNIIPLNPTAGFRGGPSVDDAVKQFVAVLARHGVPATPRVRRGIDIDAGCGQLTIKVAQDTVLGQGL